MNLASEPNSHCWRVTREKCNGSSDLHLPSSSGGLMDVRELQQAYMYLIHDQNVIPGFPEVLTRT